MLENILKYCKDEYTAIVFANIRGVVSFWTLETSLAEAKARVDNETAAYDSPDWEFYFWALKRETRTLAHKKEPVTIVSIDW